MCRKSIMPHESIVSSHRRNHQRKFVPKRAAAIEEALFVLAALLHSSIAMARPLAPNACAW
jgi:hypothetical protein